MKVFVPLILLFAVGCIGLNEKREAAIDARLLVLRDTLVTARAAGSQDIVAATEAAIVELEKERVTVSARAAIDVNNRRLLFLSILGIVTAGIKAAGKAVIS